MIVAIADTHAVIWNLYNDPRLSQTAKVFFTQSAAHGNQIALSSITLAEIIYLIEKGRIPVDTLRRLLTLLQQPLSPLVEIPVDNQVCQQMLSIIRSVIPELPDRIIAATGLLLNVPIISRDHKIASSGIATIW